MLECYYLTEEDVIVEIDYSQWHGPQRVASTNINDCHVSTVFLGLEHVGGMFETMVFSGPADQFQIRCETAEQARKIHARIVEVLQQIDWLHWHLDGNIEDKTKQLLIGLKNEDI